MKFVELDAIPRAGEWFEQSPLNLTMHATSAAFSATLGLAFVLAFDHPEWANAALKEAPADVIATWRKHANAIIDACPIEAQP